MKDVTATNQSLAHIMQMSRKQNQLPDEDLADLEKCSIDYKQADLLVKKLRECIPNTEKLSKVITSLVEVFSHHFNSAE